MRITVNHLTRMASGYICAAGLEVETSRHVRPVLPAERLPVSMLTQLGGPFEVGAEVDLGQVVQAGAPPEVEDVEFDVANASLVNRVSADEYWSLLVGQAEQDLSSIFGTALEYHRRGAAVAPGNGQASLGLLGPMDGLRTTVFVNDFGRVRVRLDLAGRTLDLSLTDTRVYTAPSWTVRQQQVEALASQLQVSEIVLSVELARQYRVTGDDRERHWLQVNGLALSADPLGSSWQL